MGDTYATLSMSQGTYVNLTYQSGHAAGEVYWDEVQIGVTVAQIESAINGTGGGGANGFDIGYQAFVAANDVGNEDLSGGQFSGVLGLALPANSVILSQLGGSTSGAPDGAPFLDNLFGSGVNAPQGRYFSLSLERLGDSRTKSSLGIGAFDDSLCPAPCVPSYSSVVTSSMGPLYWRIPLQGITTFTWPSGQAPSNTSATSTNIRLPSSSVTGQSYPVAVLDSGGYQVLMGDKSLVDAIYAVFGGSQASDGNCRSIKPMCVSIHIDMPTAQITFVVTYHSLWRLLLMANNFRCTLSICRITHRQIPRTKPVSV